MGDVAGGETTSPDALPGWPNDQPLKTLPGGIQIRNCLGYDKSNESKGQALNRELRGVAFPDIAIYELRLFGGVGSNKFPIKQDVVFASIPISPSLGGWNHKLFTDFCSQCICFNLQFVQSCACGFRENAQISLDYPWIPRNLPLHK